MRIDSVCNKESAYLIRGWHPFDPEGYSPYIVGTKEEELMAARKTAWIGVFLMHSGRQDIVGKEAYKALNEIFVNRDYSKLKIGGSRHAIRCNENGHIVDMGVIVRLGEDQYCTHGMCPGFYDYFKDTKYDAHIESSEEYFIQIDGPKSLEILEEASQSDIHDVKFAQNKWINIEGKNVFVHRLGMSGSLAYEIHGPMEDLEIVMEAVLQAGKKFHAQQQGIRTYMDNHTTGGYHNHFVHYAFPDFKTGGPVLGLKLSGTAADDVNNYFVNPYEVGWGGRVDFDHEFFGKEALLKISQSDYRHPVTLEWNLDDVMDVFKGEIDGSGVESDENIFDFDEMMFRYSSLHAEKVMAGDHFIGISAGRVRDYYHKTFISLALLDRQYAKEETSVDVMWGVPGKPQKRIRAKVARFPYYDGPYRNEPCDVNTLIPKRFS